MIAVIAAVASNNTIGLNGAIPWHCRSDLEEFKRLTLGHTVVMGRKTWQSLPERNRPLAGRTNIVITRNPSFCAPGAQVVTSLQDALDLATTDVFVIGGSEIYALALPLADAICLTRIHQPYKGDSFFPQFDPKDWKLISAKGPYQPSARDTDSYSFLTFWRRNALQSRTGSRTSPNRPND